MENTKILSKHKLYGGEIFDLKQYKVELPNKGRAEWDVVVHNGAAVIVAVTKQNEIVMVRQYRPGTEEVMLELPAGRLDSVVEDREHCALRELREETGYTAGKIKLLLTLHPLPAYCTEEVSIFLAEDLEAGKQDLDDDEFVDVELHKLPCLLDMIANGGITTMSAVIGILYYARVTGE